MKIKIGTTSRFAVAVWKIDYYIIKKIRFDTLIMYDMLYMRDKFIVVFY